MSHSEHSSLAVLHTRHLTSCYGAGASEVLCGTAVPPLNPRPERYGLRYRYQTIMSRGGWAQDRLQALGREPGVGGLAFLSGAECTHRYRDVTRNDKGQPVWAETHGYTVLTPRCDEVLRDAEAVHSWCEREPARAAKVLGCDTRHVEEAMRSAAFSLKPDDEGYGEGDLPEFVFSVLRTMIEVLRLARHHLPTDPDMWVIHHTVLASGHP